MIASRGATAVIVVAMAVLIAVPAQAANAPGSPCTSEGTFVHDDATNKDYTCTKAGGSLVWAEAGHQAGNAGSGAGLDSSAAIPKVIKNWGVRLAPYDPATGLAGVMQIKGVQPPTFDNPQDTAAYSHIVGIYGEQIKGGIQEPQMAFIAPLGTPVIAMLDGTVCDLPKLYSGDYSIRVVPKGTKCSGEQAAVLFEHEHVLSPRVKVGSKVKAGQVIATVSDYNPHWKDKGFGMVETGVFFAKNDGAGRPWHACPSRFLAKGSKAGMLTTLRSIEQAWIAERNDPALYDLAAQNPLGCLTAGDVTDSNGGNG